MIVNTKQNWEIGASVRVGFLTLVVISKEATPGDYRPDAYILQNAAGTRSYRFVPHCGLERIA